MRTTPLVRELLAVRSVIPNRYRWTQHVYHRDYRGKQIDNPHNAYSHCLIGAIQAAHDENDEAQMHCEDALVATLRSHFGELNGIEVWNDDVAREYSEVVRLIDLAIEDELSGDR
jgi:hypothetical protein